MSSDPSSRPDPGPTDPSSAFAEVAGVRFSPRGPLVWYRAGGVAASPGSWVVAEQEGVPAVGQVIMGRGQCLSFPDDPASLPELLREATPEEIPKPPYRAGRALFESLPGLPPDV